MVALAKVKTCSRCGLEKPWDAFNKNKREKFGLRNECRDCQKAYNAQSRVKVARQNTAKIFRSRPENRQRKNELERERRANPAIKARIGLYGKEYQSRLRVKARRKEWASDYNAKSEVRKRALDNRQERLAVPGAREKFNAQALAYSKTPKAQARSKMYNTRPEVKVAKKMSAARPENRAKRLVSQAENRQRPGFKRQRADYNKGKYTSDLHFKLQSQLRSRTSQAIGRGLKGGSAVSDLGCSISDFKLHIERWFTPGMSWDNHGTFWHLDHIVPLSAADLTDREQFLLVAHHENYQPLHISANLSKHNRLPREGERGWDRYRQLLALQAK